MNVLATNRDSVYIKWCVARTQPKIASSNKTDMPRRTQTLARISSAQSERFLVELANLQIHVDAIRRFRERFANFIPPHATGWMDTLVAKEEGLANEISELTGDMTLEEIEDCAWIVTLRLLLCNLWAEPDPRQKEWGAFAFRYALYKEHDALKDRGLFGILHDPSRAFRVPPPTPFEQALSHLVKVGDKARYCANP